MSVADEDTHGIHDIANKYVQIQIQLTDEDTHGIQDIEDKYRSASVSKQIQMHLKRL